VTAASIRVFTDLARNVRRDHPIVIVNTEPTSVHRALADPSRANIVGELRAAPDGLGVDELAERLGLHANTVRWHLGVLRDAGLVTARRSERRTPGRPRTIYALSREAEPRRDEFRLLASVLTSALANRDDGRDRAERAGWSWGRFVAPRREPLAPPDDDEVIDELVQLLDDQGFEPDRQGREVELRRCPYYDLAEQHPDIVCGVHRGLLAGALDELGSTLGADLKPFVRPDVCLVRFVDRA
jgi:predicted ArsR family transcriptional regulator